MKKNFCVLAFAAVALIATGCNKKSKSSAAGLSEIDYSKIELGTTGADLKVTVRLMTHRTDMLDPGYSGKTWMAYLEEFNQMYPNIKVEIEGITDYAGTALLRLQGGDWGEIMMMPAIDKKECSNYFISFGDLSVMEGQVRFANQNMYGQKVYGIPSTGNAQGVLYNKKVFEQAGIANLPKTPEEFIEVLKAIKAKTSAIPLYTNYAAGWTMSAWDAYISGSATGNADFMAQNLIHGENPFKNHGDGTHPYAVYKVLYDAASLHLIEDDYTTTDWEGCKGMLNRGEIGTMVLGSWAFTQMQGAGPNPDDIGYMTFPITVGGRQYASAGPDYAFSVNKNVAPENQMAAVIFIKWMTEKSGFSYNEGGIPIAVSDNNYPPVYEAFSQNDVEYVTDSTSPAGEEDFFANLNSESELMINAGGNSKVQALIEHGDRGDRSFDDIMNEWNEKWSAAQKKLGIEIKY